MLTQIGRSRAVIRGLLLCLGLAPGAWPAAAGEPPPRTTLSNPRIAYTVPELPYAVLRRGALEAVIVDNRAVDDAVLPGHRAGYHGVGSLKHARQGRNLFVPSYSGLNLEHIHDGAVQTNRVLFEPRNAPMQLRLINRHTAELHQPPTPYWGLETCLRYELREAEMIELTVECIPRRDTYTNGYIGLFWASYIDQPESLGTRFLVAGTPAGDSPATPSSSHWVLATARRTLIGPNRPAPTMRFAVRSTGRKRSSSPTGVDACAAGSGGRAVLQLRRGRVAMQSPRLSSANG
jgi:hypothetical protein